MSGDEAEGREAQWASAEEAFLERTKDTEGMSAEKYQRIKDLLRFWDDLSISERRERAGGNQAYWREKYSFLETEDGEGELLLLPAGDKGEEGAALKPQPVICSHQGRFFEDIKAVHLASVPRPPLPPSCKPPSCKPPLRAHVRVCVACGAESHAKDAALYKAVCARHGSSIPRNTVLRFVKHCPVCIPQVHGSCPPPPLPFVLHLPPAHSGALRSDYVVCACGAVAGESGAQGGWFPAHCDKGLRSERAGGCANTHAHTHTRTRTHIQHTHTQAHTHSLSLAHARTH